MLLGLVLGQLFRFSVGQKLERFDYNTGVNFYNMTLKAGSEPESAFAGAGDRSRRRLNLMAFASPGRPGPLGYACFLALFRNEVMYSFNSS
jgi:hypothetical protein